MNGQFIDDAEGKVFYSIYHFVDEIFDAHGPKIHRAGVLYCFQIYFLVVLDFGKNYNLGCPIFCFFDVF